MRLKGWKTKVKLFYDFKSKLILIIEIIGVFGILLGFYFGHHSEGINLILFIIAILNFIFLKICASTSWYKGYPKHAGMGLHFNRIFVAASYFIFFTAIANWFDSTIGLVVINIFYLYMTHINIYLFRIYLKDTDKSNPQIYSYKN